MRLGRALERSGSPGQAAARDVTLGVQYTAARGISVFVGMAVLGIVSGIALPARRHDLVELSVAAGLGLVLLTVMALGSERRVWGPAVRLMPFVFFVVIALLRDATGGTSSGAAPLVLFPVLWLALYERRALWWLMATLCAWLTLVLPLVVVGAPDYHSGDWRRALFLAAFAALLGWAVRRWRDAHEQAITDRLTGVPNRRLWDEALPRLVGLAKRDRKSLSVAIIDLDRFKSYNDTHGHQAGDRLLADAARAWVGQLREGDLLARYGGEEFSIALYDCAGDEACEVLDRVRSLTPEGQTCSAGVATLRAHEQWHDLVARADAALYEAKRQRNSTFRSQDKLATSAQFQEQPTSKTQPP